MEENTQEKELIESKERNLFTKIKNFFRKIFTKKSNIKEENGKDIQDINNKFKESIKMADDEEVKIFELQARYRRGEIAENDLTEEQIDAICDLYDKQIEELKQAIKIKEEKIEEYKRKNA